jgi:hypothetical protein
MVPGIFGEWQSWQPVIATRYRPRSTALPEADWATAGRGAIHTAIPEHTTSTPTLPIRIVVITLLPPLEAANNRRGFFHLRGAVSKTQPPRSARLQPSGALDVARGFSRAIKPSF